MKKHDGASLQFFVRCATKFKTCYVISRGALMYPSLVVCHPDTIKVMQSSGAPKGANYRFFKAFIGKCKEHLLKMVLPSTGVFSEPYLGFFCRGGGGNKLRTSPQGSPVYRQEVFVCTPTQKKPTEFTLKGDFFF